MVTENIRWTENRLIFQCFLRSFAKHSRSLEKRKCFANGRKVYRGNAKELSNIIFIPSNIFPQTSHILFHHHVDFKVILGLYSFIGDIM